MTTSTLPTRTVDGAPVPQPGTFTLDSAHTTVGFVARHLMVSKVRGAFGQVSGEVTIGANPLDSTVQARIAAASIDTGQPDRDQHLRGTDFLDVERFPELTFTSRQVSRRGDTYVVAGDLTIRDVTHEVELVVEFEGLARSPWGQEVIGFTATTEIDREDFGITWNQALETGGVLVGKKVRIEISAEAVRQA
ncbi:MAG: YceI family protein [Micromonosporaceae bacterium]